MNIAAIITGAAAAGIKMKIVDDRLVLSADQRPHDVLLGDLRREKPRIMEYMRSGTKIDGDFRPTQRNITQLMQLP